MNLDQARVYIVDELGKHSNRNDILQTLCRQMDIDWKQAEALLREVEASQSQTIARRQSPLIMILGIGALVGGLALTSYAVWDIFEYAQMDVARQLIYSQYIYITISSMITGLAMIVGGIVGLRKIISGILG